MKQDTRRRRSLFKRLSFPPQATRSTPAPSFIPYLRYTQLSRQEIRTKLITSAKMRLGLKLLAFLLLLVLLLCSSVRTCDARSGKHWRRNKAPSSTSLLRRKGKAKSSSGSNKPNSKGSQNPYQPSPDAPLSPGGNPVQGKGSQGPTMPTPGSGSGSGYTLPSPLPSPTPPWATAPTQSLDPVFNVVDFGAKGDGVTDDTQELIWNLGCFPTVQCGAPKDATYKTYLMQALRFYGSSNVTVTGITIVNSSQCHLKFDSCQGVMVHDITISSPENSPNTDGIHLQNSKEVNIYHINLACGDDCVSIQTGCSDINIHNVNCGPGHGISIGGLGRYNTKACVSNITVRDVKMFKTMTGVRIKTWQGGSGLVQGIRFSNIQVSEVQTPIMIDQFYCDKMTCRNQTSAVSVSGVQYENIRGTFTIKPAHFACSDTSPCSDISLTGIQLKPLIAPQYHLYNPFCWQAFGELYTPTIPPISCLQIGKPAGNRALSDGDAC